MMGRDIDSYVFSDLLGERFEIPQVPIHNRLNNFQRQRLAVVNGNISKTDHRLPMTA